MMMMIMTTTTVMIMMMMMMMTTDYCSPGLLIQSTCFSIFFVVVTLCLPFDNELMIKRTNKAVRLLDKLNNVT